MIHYDLRCGSGHEFDGWFKDSAAFDQQSARLLLDCPTCGATTVTRRLMAPSLGRKGRTAHPAGVHPAPAGNPLPADGRGTPAVAAQSHSRQDVSTHGDAPALTDQMRAVLQRLRAEVERKCDYVGNEFADEARRIHRGEVPGRAIYGESTPEQAERLADDGIDVAQIPWIPRADS